MWSIGPDRLWGGLGQLLHFVLGVLGTPPGLFGGGLSMTRIKGAKKKLLCFLEGC